MEDKYYVTEEGLEELKKELYTLVHVTKSQVEEELKAAREFGDVSENADLDAAKVNQEKVETRIRELEQLIKNAVIISESKSTKYVRLGSTVEIQELDTNNKYTYMIVGSIESDPLNGKLSNMTPLAVAIIDQKVGSVVKVNVETPYEVKILKVS